MHDQNKVYSHPLYYDIAFGWDPTQEADFYCEAFKRHAGSVRRVLELGCGTGRLLIELAKRGFYCVGLDISPEMAKFCARKARRLGVPVEVLRADMADFHISGFDAAYSAINTVSVLLTDEKLESHYSCVSKALRPGGVYVIDAALNPAPGDREEWEEERGGLRVRARWEVVSVLSEKLVLDRLRLTVIERGRVTEIMDESPSRRLSVEDLTELPKRFRLEPVAWYLGPDPKERADTFPQKGRVCVVLRKRDSADRS